MHAVLMLLWRIFVSNVAFAIIFGLGGSACPAPSNPTCCGRTLELDPSASCQSGSSSYHHSIGNSTITMTSLLAYISPTSPLLANHAFAFAAGMLVSVQIEVTWAGVRLFVAVTGNAALAASLPETAFENVLWATSISDLWGRRWHQFFVSAALYTPFLVVMHNLWIECMVQKQRYMSSLSLGSKESGCCRAAV
jgi:hypothetical protein